MLIIPPRPRCTVEPSQQNAGLVNTTAGVLENQLTRMGFITIQRLLNTQRGGLRTSWTRSARSRQTWNMATLEPPPPPELLSVKLTDGFALHHVEDATGRPHYDLRRRRLQLHHVGAHAGPSDTSMTDTVQVVSECQHHLVDLKQNYKCERKLSCNSHRR